jgi:hypothetical protein
MWLSRCNHVRSDHFPSEYLLRRTIIDCSSPAASGCHTMALNRSVSEAICGVAHISAAEGSLGADVSSKQEFAHVEQPVDGHA